MILVDVRWRPSGGRGEYEHVPQQALLNRRVIVDPLVVAGARISTDVWGRVKDGKPRLRREEPNNRGILNLPQLIAALAWLPDSIREDQGGVVLPLRHKRYVIKAISFSVDTSMEGVAVCTPRKMSILHDAGEIDLVGRLLRIGTLVRGALPPSMTSSVARYLALVNAGVAAAELRSVVDEILEEVEKDTALSASLDEPSDSFSAQPDEAPSSTATFEDIGVDETKRRLSAHYRIDRNRKIRKAKIAEFAASYGEVICENCAFSFSRKYGDRGVGFIEVHHKIPLAGLLPNTVTYLSDLVLLCSNCHRMVHRKRPDLNLEELASITRP